MTDEYTEVLEIENDSLRTMLEEVEQELDDANKELEKLKPNNTVTMTHGSLGGISSGTPAYYVSNSNSDYITITGSCDGSRNSSLSAGDLTISENGFKCGDWELTIEDMKNLKQILERKSWFQRMKERWLPSTKKNLKNDAKS